MDENNENVEPETDLGHGRSYSDRCILSRMNSDLGAGANAGSVLGIPLVATEPLSELVWSAEKGLSNVTLSPQSATGGCTAEKPIDEENFVTSDVNREPTGREAATTSPTSDVGIMLARESSHDYVIRSIANPEEVKTPGEEPVKMAETGSPINLEVDQIPEKPETEDILCTTLLGDVDRERDMTLKSDQLMPFVGQSEPLFGEPVGENLHVDDGKLNREENVILTSEADIVNETKESCALVLVTDQSSQGKRLLDRMESTADNGIQKLRNEIPYGASSQKIGSEYLIENKTSCENDEELLPANSDLDRHSPINSRMHKRQRKGKEKVLSDVNLSGKMSKKALSEQNISPRLSKEEDDSHESVESCNSGRLVSSGKKKRGFEDHFIVASKRFRNQSQEAPGCSSYVKEDSSFMNWISCVMNGFTKTIQEGAVPLSVVQPDHPSDSADKKLITYDKNQDAGTKNIGFQSIFQSLYCPRLEDKGTRMTSGNNEIRERSGELKQAIIPKVFDREKMLPVRLLKEKACWNKEPPVLSAKVSGSQEKHKSSDSVEKKDACNLERGKSEGSGSSSSSVRKQKKESEKNIEPDVQSEGNSTNKFVHGRDILGSLWITRFTPKISVPLLTSDRHTVNANFDGSNDKNKVVVNQQPVEDKIVVSSNEEQDRAADTVGSHSFNKIVGLSNGTSVSKLDPIASAPKLGGSEAMASVFARRLDALKYITQSGLTGNAADKVMTCLFCGIKGHHLSECLQIKNTQLQDMPSKFKSYNLPENLSCFCISCLECSHWAVACPNVKVGPRQSERNVSNYCSPSQTKPNSEGIVKIMGTEGGSQASVDRDDSKAVTDLNMSRKSNTTSKIMRPSSSSVKKYIVSSSGKSKIKETQVIASSPFFQTTVKDVPKGICDSVKRLQLTRTDVLKWMSSHTSILNLEGFFLRLRLGKSETVLHGTGYYVSCITGTTGSESEINLQNTRNSISVIVGGIKCVVATQYISNQDFLEDELRAWWAAMLKNNAKVPSEEDLREKEKAKKSLGL